MKKAPFGRIKAACCYCRSNFIPSHTAIYILETIARFVTVKLLLIGKIGSSAAVLRYSFDKLHDVRRSVFGHVVQRVATLASWPQGRYYASNGLSFAIRFPERYLS